MDARTENEKVVGIEAVEAGAAAVGDDAPATADGCEHGWRSESRHSTSIGTVVYVRCARCGARRVDVQRRAAEPPFALSMELESHV